MRISALHPEIVAYVKARRLGKKFEKQLAFLKENVRHPGLRVELLEPKHLRLWSFRIDKRYRAIFIFRDHETVEIIDVNDHYQ